MILKIDGHLIELMPLDSFREMHQLPADFGVGLLSGDASVNPKHRVWEDEKLLADIQTRVVSGARAERPVSDLPSLPDEVAQLLRAELMSRFDAFELTPDDMLEVEEILQDRLRPFVYAAIQLKLRPQDVSTRIDAVYRQMLSDAAAVSFEPFPYAEKGWSLYLLSALNQPIGLKIEAENGGLVAWVYDPGVQHPAVRPLEEIAFAIARKLGLA